MKTRPLLPIILGAMILAACPIPLLHAINPADEGFRPQQNKPRYTEKEKQEAINRLAGVLQEMGDKKLADRLKKDYAEGRVTIGSAGKGGTRAATGLDHWYSSANSMTLEQSELMKGLGYDYGGRGYGTCKKDDLYGWALTVSHEYVHMDQKNPEYEKQFENPAWYQTLQTNRKWIRDASEELKRIMDQTDGTPASKASAIHASGLVERLEALKRALQETTNGIREKIGEGLVDVVSGAELDQIDRTESGNIDRLLKSARNTLAQGQQDDGSQKDASQASGEETFEQRVDREVEAFKKSLDGKTPEEVNALALNLSKAKHRGQWDQDDPAARLILEKKIEAAENWKPEKQKAAASASPAPKAASRTESARTKEDPKSSTRGAASSTTAKADPAVNKSDLSAPWGHDDEMARMKAASGQVYRYGAYKNCKTVADVERMIEKREAAAGGGAIAAYIDDGKSTPNRDAASADRKAGREQDAKSAKDQGREVAKEQARSAAQSAATTAAADTGKNTAIQAGRPGGGGPPPGCGGPCR